MNSNDRLVTHIAKPVAYGLMHIQGEFINAMQDKFRNYKHIGNKNDVLFSVLFLV